VTLARLLVFVALATGCAINERSGDYTCAVQADCSSGRTCSGGLCVVTGNGSGSNNNGCPAACTTCDVNAKTCAIDGGNNVTCPTGWACNVSCSRQGSCDKLDCGGATSCTVSCSGVESCKDVQCGAGQCKVTCSGQASCAALDCRDSCACDVTCAQNACNSKPLCPTPTTCTTPTGCSSAPATCGGC